MGSTLTPTPCCSYAGLNKRPWTPEEDLRLVKYIQAHGEGNWRTLPKKAGLQRCGKGCRLRWMNYLRPNVKRGHISPEEEEMIIRLHKLLGNRWSLIAGRIPGRTDNEVKKYWNTHLRKKFNATKGFIRNHRALHGKQPGFDQTDADKNICGGQNGSSFSPYKDASSSGLAVNDLNNGSACWDIREIVSILMGDEDLCNRTEYVATENFKQSNDRFHDTVDLNASTINHFHTAWAHGNYDPSSVTSIYSPEFEPYNTCPLECSIESHTGGLYEQYSMPGFFTSMGQQLDDIVSPNINSGEKPTGDASNLQSKTAAEAQMQIHIPPYGLTYEDNSMAIDCDVFDQCSINMVLPELGQNMSLNSCLQPTDPTANQCSETWLSSFDWFDCIQQLDN